jgi:hypothetical protein
LNALGARTNKTESVHWQTKQQPRLHEGENMLTPCCPFEAAAGCFNKPIKQASHLSADNQTSQITLDHA